MSMQNGPTDHKSLNMGVRTLTNAKRDFEEQSKEGWRKLAYVQLRSSQELYEMVSNISQLYKL
jgi:hypothetical protein